MSKLIRWFMLAFLCFSPLTAISLHAEEVSNPWIANFTRTAEEKGLDAAVIEAIEAAHTICEIMQASKVAGFSDGAIVTALARTSLARSGGAANQVIACAKDLGMNIDIVTAVLNNANLPGSNVLGFSESQEANPPSLPSQVVAGGDYNNRSVSQATF